MDTNECSLCRPGGFALTRQMFQFAGIEIPEAGAAETESTDPAVPLRVIDIGCGTGGGASGGVPGVKTGRMAFDERYVCPEERAFLRRDAGTAGVC